MMEKVNTTYQYDERRKVLQEKQNVDLKDGETSVGVRKITTEYNQTGISGLQSALHKQLNDFEKNLKEANLKLLSLESLEVDEEFLAKMESFKKMQEKQNLKSHVESLTDAIKTIKQQLLDLQKAGVPKK